MNRIITILLISLWSIGVTFAQGTAFTYQGRLVLTGQPATGLYDMQFYLYAAASGGVALNSSVNNAVPVTNGLFTAQVNFGMGMFDGNPRWIELRVKTNGAATFTTLTPRQQVLPTPYAMVAEKLSTGSPTFAGTMTAGAVSVTGNLSYNGTLSKLDVAENFTATIRAADLYFGHSSRRGTPGLALSDLGSELVINWAGNWPNTHVGSSLSVGGTMNVNDVYARNIRAYSSLTIDSAANPATLRIQSAQGFGSGRVEFWSDPPGSVNEWRPGFIQSEDRGNFTGELVFYVNGTGPGNKTAFVEALRLSEGVAKVKVLTITGGADVAEPFEVSSKEVPKGSVLVIDEANPGKLKLSERAYDHRVAGIVSGANGVNPGITLQQEGVLEGGQNVALSGRVYVQADALAEPIRPGDLLTTSDVPGHAMKATDRERTHGAILGKAMTTLESGRGLVLVLVSLQ